MGCLLLILIFLVGTPLFAQPPPGRVEIDNRTNERVDVPRIQRLVQKASLGAPVDSPPVILHLWPKKALRTKADLKSDAFFVAPNEIYMLRMDYYAFLQGVLLSFHPEEKVSAIEGMSRRLWISSEMVLSLRPNR